MKPHKALKIRPDTNLTVQGCSIDSYYLHVISLEEWHVNSKSHEMGLHINISIESNCKLRINQNSLRIRKILKYVSKIYGLNFEIDHVSDFSHSDSISKL